MEVRPEDLAWLMANQPGLAVGLGKGYPWCAKGTPCISGRLLVSGYYDQGLGRYVHCSRQESGGHELFVSSRFSVVVCLKWLDAWGWPKVFDLDWRHLLVAEQVGVPPLDLHIYSDGHACLGLPFPWDPPFSVGGFISSLVEPFFYRLYYIDLYGLSAAASDLWGELPHGAEGAVAHRRYISARSRRWRLAWPLVE